MALFKFKMNMAITPQKSQLSRIKKSCNLYDEFNENKNSNLKKISFNDLISLSTTKKNKANISNQDIINEFHNKLNYYTQILHFKESQKENFMNELVLFQKWFLSYFQNLTNFDEINFVKLKNDFEKIKLTYDANLLSHAEPIEWELFYNSTNNFFEYLHNSLDKVNYNIDMENVTNNIIDQTEKMINLNDYDLFAKYGEKNYFDKSSKHITHKNKERSKKIYEIILMKYCGDFSETYYDNGKGDNKKKVKFLKMKIYFAKEENYDLIKETIEYFSHFFKRYLITYKEDKEEKSEFSSYNHFIKIAFGGICIRNKRLKSELIKLITEKIVLNCVIKLIYYQTLRECLKSTVGKLKIKDKYIYYTSNLSNHYLNSV